MLVPVVVSMSPGDGRVGPRAEQLRSAVQELPPARRHPDPCGGVDVPEKSHGAQHVLVGNGLHPLIGRARDGPQEVQRDGADLQLCQADRQVQAVLPALSHAQYAAGAHLQPPPPGPLDVGHLVLIGVCCAHLWEVSPEVSRLAWQRSTPASFMQPELLLGLEAVGGAQLQPALPMQPGVGLQGLLQLHPLQAAPGGDDREAVDAPASFRLHSATIFSRGGRDTPPPGCRSGRTGRRTCSPRCTGRSGR